MFEFDVTGDGIGTDSDVTIDVSAATSRADVADAIVLAISGVNDGLIEYNSVSREIHFKGVAELELSAGLNAAALQLSGLNDIVEIDMATGAQTALGLYDSLGVVSLGTSLAGVPGTANTSEQLGVTATAVGPYVDLYLDDGVELGLDGLTLRTAQLDASLVVDPGVIVKLNGSRIETEIGTQFVAEGTDDQSIIFTSLLDDRYGAGGTFETKEIQNATGPVPGDWGGLYFGPVSSGSLDNVYLAYGGGTAEVAGSEYNFAPVEIHQAEVRITDSVFEQNTGDTDPSNRDGHGSVTSATIYVVGAQPVIVNNVIRDNPSPAISINVNSLNSEYVIDRGRTTGESEQIIDYADNQGALIRGNDMEDNSINGMVVRGGELTTQGVWDDVDIAHVVYDEIIISDQHTYGGLRLQSSANESLVVKLEGATAGFTVTGDEGDVNDRIGGSLQIIGTAGFPVVLTSLADDGVATGFTPDKQPLYDTNNDGSLSAPEPGDWRSILLDSYSNDSNVLVYDELEPSSGQAIDTNSDPSENAEWLGELANAEQNGDDNQRLGFEVHGFIRMDDPTDIDVYSFAAEPGTEVWIDIDRSMNRLDTIVEVIDADGNVLAYSDNSFAEQYNYNLETYNPDSDVEPLSDADLGGTAQVGTLDKDSWLSDDNYTINPRDAGFRLILPGSTSAESRTYYVRVRSAADRTAATDINGDGVDDGVTVGAYQLQIRLGETDDAPGSLLRNASISYAVNGIEMYGLPTSSPLLSATSEAGDLYGTVTLTFSGPDNDLYLISNQAGAQYGNVDIIFTDGAAVGNQALVDFDGVTMIVDIDPGVTTALTIATAIAAEGTFAVAPDITLDGLANDLSGTVAVASHATTVVGTTSLVLFDDNDSFQTAQYIGNLLESDNNVISVSGELSRGIDPETGQLVNDIDWYMFTLDQEDVQAILGYSPLSVNFSLPLNQFVASAATFWPVMFDIDFADGLERPDLNIWVYDSTGELIYRAGNSENVDDQPGVGEGADIDNLTGGSVGPLDPLLGTTYLPEGDLMTYYVAIGGQDRSAAVSRLEPLRSVERIVEDHVDYFDPFGPSFYTFHPTPLEMGVPEEPARIITDYTSLIELNTHIEDFSLADVPLFVIGGYTQNNAVDLYTVDAFTGVFETDVTGQNAYGPEDAPAASDWLPDAYPGTLTNAYTYGDIAMRDDGHLMTFNRSANIASNAIDGDDYIGNYREIDTGDGSLVYDQDDGIQTYHVNNGDVVDYNYGIAFDAFAQMPSLIDGVGGTNLRTIYSVGSVSPYQPGNPNSLDNVPDEIEYVRNLLYWHYPDGIAGQYPELDSDARLATDIIPLAELFTAPTILAPSATDTHWGLDPVTNQVDDYQDPGDLLDGDQITITDAVGNTMTFEFDSGPDIRFEQTVDRPSLARDGDSFMLDDGTNRDGKTGTIFEFESGPVMVLDFNTVDHNRDALDGLTFTIVEASDAQGNPGNTNTFEFVTGQGGFQEGNIAIQYDPADTAIKLTTLIVDAVNSADWANAEVMADFVTLDPDTFTDLDDDTAIGRISFLFDAQVTAEQALQVFMPIEGGNGTAYPNSDTVLIPFEETWTMTQFGEMIEKIVASGNPLAGLERQPAARSDSQPRLRRTGRLPGLPASRPAERPRWNRLEPVRSGRHQHLLAQPDREGSHHVLRRRRRELRRRAGRGHHQPARHEQRHDVQRPDSRAHLQRCAGDVRQHGRSDRPRDGHLPGGRPSRSDPVDADDADRHQRPEHHGPGGHRRGQRSQPAVDPRQRDPECHGASRDRGRARRRTRQRCVV